MKLKDLFPLLLPALLGLVSCNKESPEQYPRAQTLYLGAFDLKPITTLDPLDSNPNWPIGLHSGLIYETLFDFRPSSGRMEPLLAKTMEHTPVGIELELDPRAAWSNGMQITASDVAYSLQLQNRAAFPQISVFDDGHLLIPISPARNNFHEISRLLCIIPILPAQIASMKKGPDSLRVSSGPYRIYKVFQDKIVLKRNDKYWGVVLHQGHLPAPRFIIHSLYNGPQHIAASMQKGYLDMTPGNTDITWNHLLFHTGREPFKNAQFRNALIPAFAPTADLAKASALLTAAHYPKDTSGIRLDPAGKPLRSISIRIDPGYPELLKQSIQQRFSTLGFTLRPVDSIADLHLEQFTLPNSPSIEIQHISHLLANSQNPHAAQLLKMVQAGVPAPLQDSLMQELNQILLADAPAILFTDSLQQINLPTNRYWKNIIPGDLLLSLWSIRPF